MRCYPTDEPIPPRLTEREERKVKEFFDYREKNSEEEDIRAIALLISAGVTTVRAAQMRDWLMVQ